MRTFGMLARLEKVPDTFSAQVRDKLGVALRDGGWRRVKNIAEPLRVFHVDHRRSRDIGDIARSPIRRAVESALAALAAALTLVL